MCDARSAFFGRFCAVFDGHGGEAAAELAAERLLAFAEARAADADGNADALGGALARAFADCEHALARAAAAQRSDPGGAVAVAAAVLPSAPPTLLLAWAGDATALLLRRGHAVRLTREHTLAEPSELRRVLLSGGEVVPPRTPADAARVVRRDANDLEHRVVPTRGIGDLQDGQPNTVLTPLPVVRTLWLSAGDELLALVSDGVTGVLTDQARRGALCGCLWRADALLWRQCRRLWLRQRQQRPTAPRRQARWWRRRSAPSPRTTAPPWWCFSLAARDDAQRQTSMRHQA